MATANIAELKNNLSRYLRRVRRGEEILVCDRKMPIAKIVPLSNANDFSAEELAMAAQGRLRLPEIKLPESFWKIKARGRRISVKRLAEAVSADREESDRRILGR